MIQDVFREHRRRYGARRIVRELAERGIAISARRVARLLKQLGLRAIQPRSFRPKTTQSRHPLGYDPNRLLDAPPPKAANQVWLADITYIPLKTGGFAYLAIVMDLYSRRIVGWELAERMNEDLVLAALRQAIVSRQPKQGIVHHSDRGGQYAGKRYRQMLARAGIRQSMSRPDNCYDNAFLESCFGTVKTEVDQQAFDSVMAARRQIADYIGYYNIRRRHSSLGYLAPADFEAGKTADRRN